MRKTFTMTPAQRDRLLAAMKPVHAMLIGGTLPSSQQENANDAWEQLGREMGFVGMTARPVPGASDLVFTAETVGE